jgi:hypothetical protein
MEQFEKVSFLEGRGWYAWYSDNYWVHNKLVKDLNRQDPTNYGLSLEDAYRFEVENLEPFNGQFLGHLGGLRW